MGATPDHARRIANTGRRSTWRNTIEEAEAEIREHRIRSPGTHHRLLYQNVDETSEIDAGTLYARSEA